LATGLIGVFLPQVLGTSYGWLQIAMDRGFEKSPIFLALIIAFAKIVATSFSIGSGGSGGVFAPALVIGGMLGAFLHSVFRMLFPWLEISVASFVVVGMAAFLGGVSKAPVATIIMVIEMTRGYTLIAPSIIATLISYLITGSHTIYRSQVPSKMHFQHTESFNASTFLHSRRF
jgi:CIC family chloride channel protein